MPANLAWARPDLAQATQAKGKEEQYREKHSGISRADGRGMKMPLADRLCVLRFASSFLWADLSVDRAEHTFFLALARELGFPSSALPMLVELLDLPPDADDIDPTRVPSALASTVRDVALRAIASDGRVLEREMHLFDLLDELLPPTPSQASAQAFTEHTA